MQKITPFMWFDKNAEEAITFYTSIFKDAKIVSIKRYPEGPLEGPMKGMEGKVLTAVFELEGQRFMAIDGGPFFQPSGAISFYIECETQEEVDHYWNALTAGGDPAAQQCGWLKDKFGFSWQVVPKQLPEYLSDNDAAKAGRVMAAMMQMKKIDIAGLKKAYEA
ncbi:MAG TPA: VOC family protein [Candidatus Paceibacterota bacterium]|nr:VOC family protein [Candidatus Paceibacterota bacterium]